MTPAASQCLRHNTANQPCPAMISQKSIQPPCSALLALLQEAADAANSTTNVSALRMLRTAGVSCLQCIKHSHTHHWNGSTAIQTFRTKQYYLCAAVGTRAEALKLNTSRVKQTSFGCQSSADCQTATPLHVATAQALFSLQNHMVHAALMSRHAMTTSHNTVRIRCCCTGHCSSHQSLEPAGCINPSN
jgi:hypothetical protein